MEIFIIGNVRRLNNRCSKKDLSWEEDKISLKTKANLVERVGLADRVSISERKNIIINVIDDDKGLTSFCWCIG
jgi:hypothetical protein